jgi:hypothetical protein
MGVIFNIEESIKNSGFNILQEPIKMILENQTEAFEKNSIISKFFVMKTTDRYLEEYRSMTSMDGFKPTEDMEVANISDFEESYFKQFTTQTWTNSFVISKQTLEDNKMMNIDASATGFIKSYNRTREQYAVEMIGAALGNTYPEHKIGAKDGKGMDTVLGDIEGDKQQYFHKLHKTVKLKDGRDQITQSNKFYAELDLESGEVADLEEKILDVIGQVEAIMATYKDDKGNIVPVDVDTIFVGKNYRLVDILTRGLKSRYGAAMDGNGINTQYGKYNIVVSPYLSGIEGFRDVDNGLILMSSERNKEGLGAVWFDRKPLEVRSYKDDKTEANVWVGRARFGAGYGDFRAMSYISFPTSEASAKASENAKLITPVSTGVKAVKVVNGDKSPVKTKEVAGE